MATALASLDDHGLSFMELYIARLNAAFNNDENGPASATVQGRAEAR